MGATELIITDRWPKNLVENEIPFLFIYDQVLKKSLEPVIKKFPRGSVALPVKAGETLKSIKNYSIIVSKIQAASTALGLNKPAIYACGGGSVGDFAGFVASTFRRGLPLCHIPSTWLSAIDSAHGGKNGLNLNGTKNQIGTFYSADKTLIVKELLFQQPKERAVEGLPELLKVLLCTNVKITERLLSRRFESGLLWDFLPTAIEEKLKVVKRDPLETLGYRRILNFGHTLGHVFEASVPLPHGIAVYFGMEFAFRWARHNQILDQALQRKLQASPLITSFGEKLKHIKYKAVLKKTAPSVSQALAQDKKGAGANKLWFIFLKKIAEVEQIKLSLDEVVTELHRQLNADAPGVLLP